jgi:hypothetical protein
VAKPSFTQLEHFESFRWQHARTGFGYIGTHLDLGGCDVGRLTRREGCRRHILGQCLDGKLHNYKMIEGAVFCNNSLRKEVRWQSKRVEPGHHHLGGGREGRWRRAWGGSRMRWKELRTRATERGDLFAGYTGCSREVRGDYA